ncbi:hypothetical protein LTS07_005188 [Exophiala sideris]|uniref:Uncharacterized protein n=1 Tax=Exophiala sideris TaxID=1016849 RepID=A0ABR0JBC1_9EURO|nr:hypothetical protein LTS07_005188 [Exophiala sideris]KAK5038457.1 hypothetical protein LTR13_004204 [Exophiala sideris]KAK5060340.1 hypothetical protein LTR69_005657 [Exophiala sideris]KAK5183250.1 hypothetical protein LTR44_004251 [Eurotiomycetes sp. CCFEE 6388]
MTTFAEWTTLINNQLPVEVYFEQTTMEEWAAMVDFIPGLGMELAQMWSYCEKVGYFGGQNGGTRIITDPWIAYQRI